ncbi:MAG: hypothetical protein U0354_04840 [Candidatus Sericytochromatia bacterium]
MELRIGDSILVAKTDKTSVVNKPVEKKDEINNKHREQLLSKLSISNVQTDHNINKNKVQFSDDNDSLDETLETSKEIVQDENTLSVVGSVLSAVKIPQAEPFKLTVNILTADNKKEKLAKDLECHNYEGIVNNTVDFAKSGLGTAISGAKLLDLGTNIIVDLGIISSVSKTASGIGKVTKTISTVGTKVAIPFSIIGTGLNAWDIKSAQDKINLKKEEIQKSKHIKPISVGGCVVGVGTSVQEKELNTLKTNRNLKAVAFGFSTVSTATLIQSVRNPSKAPTYMGISLVTSIASSVTSALADDKLRDKVKKLF